MYTHILHICICAYMYVTVRYVYIYRIYICVKYNYCVIKMNFQDIFKLFWSERGKNCAKIFNLMRNNHYIIIKSF